MPQVPTQLFTAAYFCFIDSLMVLQWLHYNKWRAKEGKTSPINSMLVPLVLVAAPLAVGLSSYTDLRSAAGLAGRPALTPSYGGARTLLGGPKVTAAETTRGLWGYIFGEDQRAHS